MAITHFPGVAPTSLHDYAPTAPRLDEQPRVHPMQTLVTGLFLAAMVLLILLGFLLSTLPHAGLGP